jgi:hypothetical protein
MSRQFCVLVLLFFEMLADVCGLVDVLFDPNFVYVEILLVREILIIL